MSRVGVVFALALGTGLVGGAPRAFADDAGAPVSAQASLSKEARIIVRLERDLGGTWRVAEPPDRDATCFTTMDRAARARRESIDAFWRWFIVRESDVLGIESENEITGEWDGVSNTLSLRQGIRGTAIKQDGKLSFVRFRRVGVDADTTFEPFEVCLRVYPGFNALPKGPRLTREQAKRRLSGDADLKLLVRAIDGRARLVWADGESSVVDAVSGVVLARETIRE